MEANSGGVNRFFSCQVGRHSEGETSSEGSESSITASQYGTDIFPHTMDMDTRLVSLELSM